MARDFNGSTTYLEATSNPFNVSNPFTFGCRFYPRNVTTIQTTVTVEDASDASQAIVLNMQTDGSIGLFMKNNAGASLFADSTGTMSANTWNTVVGYFDGTDTASVYLNAESPVSDTEVGYSSPTGLDRTTVGSRYNVGSRDRFFDGIIQDVFFFNSAVTLNAGQIAAFAAGMSPVEVWGAWGATSTAIASIHDLIDADLDHPHYQDATKGLTLSENATSIANHFPSWASMPLSGFAAASGGGVGGIAPHAYHYRLQRAG